MGQTPSLLLLEREHPLSQQIERILEHITSLFPADSQPILLFCETGPSPPPSTPHHRLGSFSRTAPIRGPGRGRGIFAYVPHSLIGVVSIELETPHCLWLRVKGGAGDGVDLFVGTVYFPPANGRRWRGGQAQDRKRDAFKAVRDDILSFQRGCVMLMGDFNAHVDSLADILPDSDALLSGPLNTRPFTASACRVPAERTTAQPGSAACLALFLSLSSVTPLHA